MATTRSTRSLGNDVLIGGAGTDTISYAASTGGVTAYLGGTVGVGGYAAGDTLSGFEILIGSAHADTLYGSSTADTLSGGDGDDVLWRAARAGIR